MATFVVRDLAICLLLLSVFTRGRSFDPTGMSTVDINVSSFNPIFRNIGFEENHIDSLLLSADSEMGSGYYNESTNISYALSFYGFYIVYCR